MTLDRYDMLFYICKYILLYINYYIATTVIYFTITYRAGAGAPTKVLLKQNRMLDSCRNSENNSTCRRIIQIVFSQT